MKSYISQGSVATQLMCGGLLSNHFITQFQQNVPVEKYEDRSLFGDDMDIGQKFAAYFLGQPSNQAINQSINQSVNK